MTSHEQLVAALKEVLTDEQPDGLVLVKRIPFICKDINDIKVNQGNMKTKQDLSMWLLAGIAGGIGMLALKQLGI